MKPVYYDSAIYFGILVSLSLWAIFLLFYPLLSLLSLLITFILIWGSFIEPRLITIAPVTIKLHKPIREFKIAVLADLHAGPYKKAKFFTRVVETTLSLDPDLVVLVGDHIFNCVHNEKEVEYLYPLKKLTEKIPVYAVHGNHEYGLSDYIPTNPTQIKFADVSGYTKAILESYGIKYLHNQTLDLTIKGQKICLFGGDEVWTGNLNYSTLKNKPAEIPKIALVHNPAYLYHPHPEGIDLTISGHTHGGQIRLPFIGPMTKADNLIPKKLYEGLHEPERAGEYLFVTRGLGESEARARLFCPPEIALLTIGQKENVSSRPQTV